MVIGVLTGELFFPENHSLKGKRMLLQKLFAQLKQRLNVSVAEVEHQDLWQRSGLAVACVNTSSREANATLNQALAIIDSLGEMELIDHHFEMR
jgi:uncharacterized protein YlxP (DUF503 family)